MKDVLISFSKSSDKTMVATSGNLFFTKSSLNFDRSKTATLTPNKRAIAIIPKPMGPAPITKIVSLSMILARSTACAATAKGSIREI
ncbi:hypothetical protein D3C72_2300110 [compost metagenome]